MAGPWKWLCMRQLPPSKPHDYTQRPLGPDLPGDGRLPNAHPSRRTAMHALVPRALVLTEHLGYAMPCDKRNTEIWHGLCFPEPLGLWRRERGEHTGCSFRMSPPLAGHVQWLCKGRSLQEKERERVCVCVCVCVCVRWWAGKTSPWKGAFKLSLKRYIEVRQGRRARGASQVVRW